MNCRCAYELIRNTARSSFTEGLPVARDQIEQDLEALGWGEGGVVFGPYHGMGEPSIVAAKAGQVRARSGVDTITCVSSRPTRSISTSTASMSASSQLPR